MAWEVALSGNQKSYFQFSCSRIPETVYSIVLRSALFFRPGFSFFAPLIFLQFAPLWICSMLIRPINKHFPDFYFFYFNYMKNPLLSMLNWSNQGKFSWIYWLLKYIVYIKTGSSSSFIEFFSIEFPVFFPKMMEKTADHRNLHQWTKDPKNQLVSKRLKFSLLIFAFVFWVLGGLFAAIGGWQISQTRGMLL